MAADDEQWTSGDGSESMAAGVSGNCCFPVLHGQQLFSVQKSIANK